VRRAAARGLGQLRCGALAEDARLLVWGRALEALEAGGEDGEWVVRYAVVVGLEGLGLDLADPQPGATAPEAALLARVLQALNRHHDGDDTVPVVRLRARQALGRLSSTAT
jgi:phycocyanobilin lyase beta subunit